MVPLAAGEAQEDETILDPGFSGHGLVRFVHLDPPRLDRVSVDYFNLSDRLSGALHNDALDDDAGSHIFPAARHSAAWRASATMVVFLEMAAIAVDPLLEPQELALIAADCAGP